MTTQEKMSEIKTWKFPALTDAEKEHRPPYAAQGSENGNRGYVNFRDYSAVNVEDEEGNPRYGGLEYLHMALGYNDNSSYINEDGVVGDSFRRGFLKNHRPSNSRGVIGGVLGFEAMLEATSQKNLKETGLGEWIEIKKFLAPSWNLTRQMVHTWFDEKEAVGGRPKKMASPAEIAKRAETDKAVREAVVATLTTEELEAMLEARKES